jgi:flagellar assembly factor FliW
VTVHLVSEQLGPLEIPDDSLVSFAQGIPGFPTARRFCLLEVKPGSRFKLLQNVEDPALAFVVTDPVALDPSYPLDTVRELASLLGLAKDEPMAIASIVTVPPPPRRPTANLLAPLAMGMQSRLGVQVVLHDGDYRVRHEM